MIPEAVPGEQLVRDPYIGESQRAYLRQRTTLDNILHTGLVQQRAQACDFILLHLDTDLEGAFDTASQLGLDKAMAAAGAGTKTRNVWRMIYKETRAMIRMQTPGGDLHYSRRYSNERGGNQGTVLMPLNFILLTHYVYLRGDPHRHHLLGTGELTPIHDPARCKMCESLYKRWLQPRPTRHCRGCKLIRKLPDLGFDEEDDSEQREAVVSAAREQFDELDKTNSGTLNEEEVEQMVEQLLPAGSTRERIDEAVEEVMQFAETAKTYGWEEAPGLEMEFDGFVAAWEWLGGDAFQRQLTARGRALQAREEPSEVDEDEGEGSAADSDSEDDEPEDLTRRMQLRRANMGDSSSDSDEDSADAASNDGDGGSSDGDDGVPEEMDDYDLLPPLPEDHGLAVVELRRRIAAAGGQEPLVRVTMEYADDQTQVMALERQPGVPREWRLEEQILAADATTRLLICMQVYSEIAGYKMSVGKCYVRWGVGAQPLTRRTGPITNEELQSLNLQFECAGCERKEATMASRCGHEHRCPYVCLVRHWHNPATAGDGGEGAGTWEVERVLQLRGPPEARYVQLLWAPTDLDLDADGEHHEFGDLEDAEGQPRSGDGSWAYGWQPMANCLNLTRTLIADWLRDNRDIDPQGCIERLGEWRCEHCNYISTSQSRTHRHVDKCRFKPLPRRRDSVVGRMLARRDVEQMQQQFPKITITDPDTGEMTDLQAKHDTTSLGHIFSADASSDKDMRARMAKADVEFYRATPLWRCPVLTRKSKLRMYRRYLMILVYAGAVCWVLDAAALKNLNHWNGAKMAAITGNTWKAENKKRRVDVGGMIRYWRRRLLGEVLRAHPDDMRRGELIQHAELVRKGRIPKAGSIVMDAPDYDNVEELKRKAGYVPPGALETLTVARSAKLERNHVQWVEDDERLKPDEMGSEEENDEESAGCKNEEQQAAPQTEEENELRMQQLRERTALEIVEATDQLRSQGVRYVWLVYHDGGYTPAEKDKSKEKSGWGYTATVTDLQTNAEIEQREGYGPVQLDPDDNTFCGCIQLSNNTAELSAVPHVLTDAICWRRRNSGRRGVGLAAHEPLGMIMVYDSQYTKDQCTMRRPPDGARQLKNATVVAVCRRLIQAAVERTIDIKWVKVKGHSDDAGNDAADLRANWAQSGGTKNEQDIDMMMSHLRDHG